MHLISARKKIEHMTHPSSALHNLGFSLAITM